MSTCLPIYPSYELCSATLQARPYFGQYLALASRAVWVLLCFRNLCFGPHGFSEDMLDLLAKGVHRHAGKALGFCLIYTKPAQNIQD